MCYIPHQDKEELFLLLMRQEISTETGSLDDAIVEILESQIVSCSQKAFEILTKKYGMSRGDAEATLNTIFKKYPELKLLYVHN